MTFTASSAIIDPMTPASALGDYDHATGTFVVGRVNSQEIWLIDLNTLAITTFNNGAVVNTSELRRFGEIFEGFWYSQFSTQPVTRFDLSDNSLPLQTFADPGEFYESATVNPFTETFYVNRFASTVFAAWDPVADSRSPLAPAPSSNPLEMAMQ